MLENGICLRCIHLLASGLQSVTFMFSVTRFAVYQFILTLVLLSKEAAALVPLISIQQQHPL